MRVACVLLPHLPVALARRRDPALRGRPLVVLDGPDPSPGRTRVLDASAEARAAGIAPGLPPSQVHALLPAAAVVPLDADGLAATDRALLTALLATCPAAEPAGPGAAFADLTGLGDLFGDEAAACRRLAAAARAATGLVPQVGAADGKFPAEAAARAAAPGRPQIVPPEDTAAFLAPLPVELLPAPDEVLARLRRLGLHTLGDLAALPPAAVQAQFGRLGGTLWALAAGRDARPLVPHRPAPALRARLELPAPTTARPALLAAARTLLARLAARPDRRGRAARLLTIRLDSVDGGRWERRLPLRPPAAEPDRLLARLRPALATAALPGPVEALELALAGLGGEAGVQGQLVGATARDRAALREAVRGLAARYGRSPILRIVPLEPWSRLPERRWALVEVEP